MAAYDHQMEVMESAITAGNSELVQDLVECGVSVNGKYRTPLSTAVKEGQMDIANILIRNGADVNTGGQFFEPALILAVRACNTAMIQLLIDAGARINGEADEGLRVATKLVYTTPMHVAATKENPEILNILLAANGDVNLRNIKLETPLHLAAYSGNPRNIERLVVCGAHHDIMDKQGYTPLHHAVCEGHVNCVRELCKLGSSINLPTSMGCTPLMLAVKKAQLGALKTLLQFKPTINRTEEEFQRTVAHTVIEACPHRIRRRNVISVNKEIEMMESLVQAGVDVNIADKNGETPLHLCVRTGCAALLEYLIKCKHINVNTINTGGHTPLMTACSMHENHIMIKLLMQYCPLLVANTITMKKPSQGLMMQLAEKDNIHCMKLLLEAGYHCSKVEADSCRESHENDSAIVRFVDEQLLQPWPLQRICKGVIRNALSTELHDKIFYLPVPQKLRDMIILQDVFVPS